MFNRVFPFNFLCRLACILPCGTLFRLLLSLGTTVSRVLHVLVCVSEPCLLCCPCSLADRSGALKCTFSAAGHSTGLLQGLAALRAQGQLLDVVLTVNSEAFHAHKVVLAACSDYFR